MHIKKEKMTTFMMDKTVEVSNINIQYLLLNINVIHKKMKI